MLCTIFKEIRQKKKKMEFTNNLVVTFVWTWDWYVGSIQLLQT